MERSGMESFPSAVGTGGKIRKGYSRSFGDFSTGFHSAAVSTALASAAGGFRWRKHNAQTESLDAGEALRDSDGNLTRQGDDLGHSQKTSGLRCIDTSMARAFFPSRQIGAVDGGARITIRSYGPRAADSGAATSDRRAIGGDPFFKKAVEEIKPSWQQVEEARAEFKLPVTRAISLLGMSRTSYYRRVRGMVDYEPREVIRASAQYTKTLREVALQRQEAGHRKVRQYAIAWGCLQVEATGTSRMSCYRSLKAEGLIQPGRPAIHLKQVRDRRRQLLEVPTDLNQVLQGDFTDYETEDGGCYHIGCFTEYLSRFNLVARVLDTETAVDLIAVTEHALEEILSLGHELPPRVVLVTDNGPAMKSRRFRNFIQKTDLLVHVRGQKYHPQTIGREERFHGSLKLERLYRVLPENRDQLVSEVKSYREFYNHERVHQSLEYLTPAQVYLKGLAVGSSYLSVR